MDVYEVHDLVRRGRAIKSARYHPGKRGLSFVQILLALERCHLVAPDPRRAPDGRRLHPKGWFALAHVPGRRRLRVDFDAWQDDQGRLLLIVTAYHV